MPSPVTRRYDPLELRQQRQQQARAEQAKNLTFDEAAERCIAAKQPGWKGCEGSWGLLSLDEPPT
jgi:hypothetical protein